MANEEVSRLDSAETAALLVPPSPEQRSPLRRSPNRVQCGDDPYTAEAKRFEEASGGATLGSPVRDLKDDIQQLNTDRNSADE
jgi:hypothetical protein